MTAEPKSKFVNYNDFENSTGGSIVNQMNNINNQMNYINPNMNFNQNKMKNQTANVLFVADLPDETCEEDLMGLFKDYKYKVSRVTNSTNRTYALVHFESAEFAEKARNDLNGVKLVAKYASLKFAKPIRLCRWETKVSINERKDDDYKKNLLVKNLDKDVSAHMFWKTFIKYGDVRSCKLSVDYSGLSKGFGYITYYNSKDAEIARNALNNSDLQGKQLSIEFLQPGLKKKIKKNNVYVKKFPRENFSDQNLRELFEPFGELISVMVAPDITDPTKNRGFGFVCYKNADDAENAQIQLNNKKIWENQPSIYVSFAMKREERIEHFQKKKEELLRNSSRMTVFCKVKEGFNFQSEQDLNKEIMMFLCMCFGENYNPRSLKSRIDSKTAFITLNNINEVDVFINFYSEFSKSQPASLYFNPYKSKIERINASNIMKKKYNDFNSNNINQEPFDIPKQTNNKIYNEFYNQQMMMMNQNNISGIGGLTNNNMNMNMGMNNPIMMQNFNPYIIPQQTFSGMKNYNNFDDINKNMNSQTSNNNNNINVNSNLISQQPQKSKQEQEAEEREAYLDKIYEFVQNIYPQDASKITGMISELSIQEIEEFANNNSKLEGIAKAAHNQLNK